MFHRRTAIVLTLLLGIAAPLSAQNKSHKIDEALTHAVKAGCTTEKVIIRTKRGYRAGMTLSLRQHGDTVASEHPSIDAVSAEVHCGDLATMEGFSSVLSISKDAIVRADGAVTADKRAKTHAKPASKASTHAKRDAPKADRLAAGKSAGPRQDAISKTRGVRPARGRSGARSNRHDNDDNDDGKGKSNSGKHAEHRKKLWAPPARLSVTTDASPNDNVRRWAGVDGAGGAIGVAIIDSGINPSPGFGGRITHFYDFTDGQVRETTPSDAYGHGTHVAGLIGSSFVGVNPDATLIGLRVLDGKGRGRTSDVLRAIEFATANKDALGIRVLNLSLGHPVYEPAATDPLVQAVESAVRAGLVVVTSAGNFGMNSATGAPGYAGITSPGNAPSALTVGAIKTFDTAARGDDRIAQYSSRGPSWYDGFAKPDVTAPGDALLSVAGPGSALRQKNEARGGDGDYMRLSGTSMAAAVASGVVTLVLHTNPGLTPNALKAVLEFTAIPVVDPTTGKPFDALTQGAGGINGAGALALAGAIDASQPVGGKWLATGLPFESALGGETLQWSSLMIWGSHRAYGGGVVDENRPAWATNVVWGTLAQDEDNIVWGTAFDEGDNIVWGTNIVWSLSADEDNIVWGTTFDEGDNIVWGTNIVWGNALIGIDEGDNIVWGTVSSANVVWGNLEDVDNVVWGTLGDEDNIVWGTALVGGVTAWGDRVVIGTRSPAGLERHATRKR